MKTFRALAVALSAILPVAASAQPPGLTARPVRDFIRLTVQPTEGSTPAKRELEIVWVVDREDRVGESFAKDQQFGAKGRPIAITVANFNPLTSALTITVDDVADPTHETLGKLVESLLSVSTILGAKIPDGIAGRMGGFAGDCGKHLSGATDDIRNLNDALNDEIWSSKSIRKEIDNAARAIETNLGKGGALAAGDGVRVLEAFLGSDEDNSDAKTLRARLKDAQNLLKKIEAAATNRNADKCEAAVQHIYLLAITANPSERLATFTKVVKNFSDIVESIREYTVRTRWSPAYPMELIARRGINPTSATMKKVKVKHATRSYQDSAIPGVLTLKDTDSAAAEFTVRRYSAWVPEIGVGLTFNQVDRPIYGTGKNAAGETIIALSATDKSTKIDPTLMVNFVCGFCRLSPVTPMFQIGTSTSKTTPAILVGGGVRFLATSKGDFAIGFGWIVPWAKQLKNEGDLNKVIAGTAALEEHLEWRIVDKFHKYVTLQYKF